MCVGAGLATLVYSGLQVASGVMQANSIRQQGQAQNNYYQYLAAQNEQQAQLAERTGAAQSHAVQETQKLQGQRLKTSQAEFNASQQAALAANGIYGSVTASDIQRSTASKQALDENLLRFDADTKSYEATVGAQNQAYSLRSGAAGYRAAGANSLYASKIAARNSLIGTAVSAISPFIFRPFK